MNKRIQELADQAKMFSIDNGGWRISTRVPNDFQTKFAELIIQECQRRATESKIREYLGELLVPKENQ